MKRWLLGCGALLAVACGPQADPPIESGTLKLQFQIEQRVRADIDPKIKLAGTIYGDLYLAEDVTVVGPIDDAMAYASIALPADLTMDGVAAASWTSAELGAQRYAFLGFFDVGDKSTPAKRRPQAGDPVTLAFTNRFDVEAGKPSQGVVRFDLLYN